MSVLWASFAIACLLFVLVAFSVFFYLLSFPLVLFVYSFFYCDSVLCDVWFVFFFIYLPVADSTLAVCRFVFLRVRCSFFYSCPDCCWLFFSFLMFLGVGSIVFCVALYLLLWFCVDTFYFVAFFGLHLSEIICVFVFVVIFGDNLVLTDRRSADPAFSKGGGLYRVRLLWVSMPRVSISSVVTLAAICTQSQRCSRCCVAVILES